MKLRNDAKGWGLFARLLHWAMAAAILYLLGLGVYMVEIIPNDGTSTSLLAKYPWYQLHKSWGFVVFTLAVIRVIWRLSDRKTPALPTDMPRWQVRASHASHMLLYILIIAVPVSGWLMVSASPLQDMGMAKNMVFGWFDMPDPFVPGDGDVEETFKALHFWLVIALSAVLALHLAAALKHHFIERDNILRRMIIGR